MTDLNTWITEINNLIPELVLGFIILVIVFVSSGALSSLLTRPFKRATTSQLIHTVTRRAIRLLIILIGVYVFLSLAGLTKFAVAILSGTGVIGLILGFAFKDIAENFISSLLLSIQRPFRIGDVIEVQGYLGVIKQVTARATTLVDFDGNHIQIPNATIYKNVIKNFSANPNMRGHFIIGIGYDNDAEEALNIALEVLNNENAVLTDPEPQVLIDNLGASTLNLKVYFWIDATKYSIFKVSSRLMRLVTHTFEANGISMPDDARERIFPDGINVISDGDTAVIKNNIKHERPTPSPDNSQTVNATKKVDNMTSEIDEIRKQAIKARDPESGENIF